MLRFSDRGFYIPYHEKSQAGLFIHDRRGLPLFSAAYPEQNQRKALACSIFKYRTLNVSFSCCSRPLWEMMLSGSSEGTCFSNKTDNDASWLERFFILLKERPRINMRGFFVLLECYYFEQSKAWLQHWLTVIAVVSGKCGGTKIEHR